MIYFVLMFCFVRLDRCGSNFLIKNCILKVMTNNLYVVCLVVDTNSPSASNGIVTTAPNASAPSELASAPPINPDFANGAYHSLSETGEGAGPLNPETIILTQPQPANVIPATSEKKSPPTNENWL